MTKTARRRPSARSLAELAPAPRRSFTSLAAGQSILAQLGAAFVIDAAKSIAGEQWALNQGSAGQVLRAQYGSVGRAEVRQGALLLPGTSGNSGYVNDAAALDITGDIEIVMRVAADAWPPALNSSLVAKWTGGGQLAYGFGLLAAGTLVFYTSPDGTTDLFRQSTVALPATPAGTTLWLKAICDVDNGAVGNTVTFYYAADSSTEPTVWTQLGAPVTLAGTTSIMSTTADLIIGGSNLINPLPCVIYRCIVRSGIGGPRVLDADFAGCPDLATSYVGTHGIGIKGGALVLPGNYGCYASVPDSAALDITGDIDLRARINLSGSSSQGVICKTDTSTQRSYEWRITPGGTSILELSATGGAPTAASSSATFAAAAQWARVTWRQSDGRVQFFTAPDSSVEPTGGGWTQVGIDGTIAVASIFASTSAVTIGTRTFGNNPAAGAIRRAIVRNGIDGAVVLNADFAGPADDTQSFVCPTGQTITIVGCARPTVTIAAVNAVDAADLPLATHTGQSYVHLTSAIGNYVLASQSAAPSVDIVDFAVRVRLDAIGVTNVLAGWDSTYASFQLDGANRLVIGVRDVTTAFIGQAQSTASPPGLAPGVDIWLRGQVTTATAQCAYWYSYDNTNDVNSVTFIPLGTTVIGIGAGLTAVASKSSLITAGTDSVGIAGINGRVYAMRAAINGSTFMSWVASSSGITKLTSGTMTIGRQAGAGRKAEFIDRPYWVAGSGYLQIADNALLDLAAGGSLGVLIIGRVTAPPSGSTLVSKATSVATGAVEKRWVMRFTTGNVVVFIADDGVTQMGLSQGTTDGVLFCKTMTMDASTFANYSGAVLKSSAARTSGDSANALPVMIGSTNGGGLMEGVIAVVAIKQGVWTTTELTAICKAYSASLV